MPPSTTTSTSVPTNPTNNPSQPQLSLPPSPLPPPSIVQPVHVSGGGGESTSRIVQDESPPPLPEKSAHLDNTNIQTGTGVSPSSPEVPVMRRLTTRDKVRQTDCIIWKTLVREFPVHFILFY